MLIILGLLSKGHMTKGKKCEQFLYFTLKYFNKKLQTYTQICRQKGGDKPQAIRPLPRLTYAALAKFNSLQQHKKLSELGDTCVWGCRYPGFTHHMWVQGVSLKELNEMLNYCLFFPHLQQCPHNSMILCF